jgi:hypothetical protein
VADAARALGGTLLAVLLPALIGNARVALLGGVCCRANPQLCCLIRCILFQVVTPVCALPTTISRHQRLRMAQEHLSRLYISLWTMQAAQWCGSASTRWRT